MQSGRTGNSGRLRPRAGARGAALRVCEIVGMLALPAIVAAQGGRAPAAAQGRRSCDGDTVTTIDVRAHPPSYAGMAAGAEHAATSRLGFEHTPTRSAVITAYLRVAAGKVCTERDRSESERLLRAQPYIASAAVRAIPESPGHVRLQVDVVDELRLVAGIGFARGTVSSLLLGTQNYSGAGMAIAAKAERGFAYQDGFGAALTQYGIFGKPDFLTVEAERRTVAGDHAAIELAEPFLTDLQRGGFHSRLSTTSGFSSLMRPDGADVSVFVHRTVYDAGWVRRLGRTSGSGAVGLVGGALLGEDARTDADLVIVSDTGLIPGPANSFGAQYPAIGITRVAAIGGLRALRFITVTGFDALNAEQDLGIGVQLDAIVGPSVMSSGHPSDIFVAGDLYAGFGHDRSFFVVRALAEAHRTRETHFWDGVVASGRLAWYGVPGNERTHLVNIDFAAVQRLAFPMQLTLRDGDGGLPGYGDATWAGGQRVVARAEERWFARTLGTRADLGFAVFAAAGKLWAGDVPYGHTTPVFGSTGVSLIAAVPSGGKRTYRIDFALPVNPDRGGVHLEVRFSSSDRTRMLWLEPGDVARARTGAVPASLMKW